MKETIKKVIYHKLSSIPDNKALLWPDFQIAFEVATGKSLNDYLDDAQAAADELEHEQYALFEKLPNNMIRIVRGVDFDKWGAAVKQSSQGNQINISSLTANNVQIGSDNTMNINITPEEFVNALNKLRQEPEKAQSILDQLNSYVKKGLSFGETVAKFIALIG